jgi:hypothetical protein
MLLPRRPLDSNRGGKSLDAARARALEPAKDEPRALYDRA